MAAEEERATTSRVPSAYGLTLKILPQFKYLGRVVLAADEDWPEVIRNLTKARGVWRRTTRILSREGGRLQVPVLLFKAVVQLVLLFDAETWVVNPHMRRVLGAFHD